MEDNQTSLTEEMQTEETLETLVGEIGSLYTADIPVAHFCSRDSSYAHHPCPTSSACFSLLLMGVEEQDCKTRDQEVWGSISWMDLQGQIFVSQVFALNNPGDRMTCQVTVRQPLSSSLSALNKQTDRQTNTMYQQCTEAALMMLNRGPDDKHNDFGGWKNDRVGGSRNTFSVPQEPDIWMRGGLSLGT